MLLAREKENTHTHTKKYNEISGIYLANPATGAVPRAIRHGITSWEKLLKPGSQGARHPTPKTDAS